MGAYIYGLTPKPQTITVDLDGESCEAGFLEYVYKPWTYGMDADTENRRYERAHRSKVDRGWRGKTRPRYAIVVNSGESKPRTMNQVFRWHPRKVFINDYSDEWETRTVGYLIPKAGGGWRVGSYYESYVERLRAEPELSTGCDLFVEGDAFVMTGPSGRHELSIAETDMDRLQRHWGGFCKANKAAFDMSKRRPGESVVLC